MASTCFCGCGRRLGLLERRISRLGARQDRALSAVRTVVIPELERRAGGEDPADHDYAATIAAAEEFVNDGVALRARLVAACHGITADERQEINRWQTIATRNSRRALKDRRRRAREDAAEIVLRRDRASYGVRVTGPDPDAARQSMADAVERGVERGFGPDEAMRLVVDAMIAGEVLPFTEPTGPGPPRGAHSAPPVLAAIRRRLGGEPALAAPWPDARSGTGSG